MNLTLLFMRSLFMMLSILLMTFYMTSAGFNPLFGVLAGSIFGFILFAFDLWFKRFNLRAFNIAVVGLFVGYLMGEALVLIFSSVLDISQASFQITKELVEVIQIGLFLFGIYLGTLITLRSADEISISVPFIRFSPTGHKKKDLIIDNTVLSDARIIDLAATGLVDQQLCIPRFLVKELYVQLETQDENLKARAKKALDTLKKLEAIPSLELRYNETDFPDVKDPISKIIRLARLSESNILTADLARSSQTMIEGIKMINLHTLSTALKPLMQSGEMIKIKIQRFGKEPRQGVGYLEDGTMVVVNGGGQYMGETIEAKVLSVKHTTSGRMIFCNAMDEEGTFQTHYEEE